MIKTSDIDFTEVELALLNNVILDHCLSLVELVNEQKTEENYKKAMTIMQASIAAQHLLFSNAVKGEKSFPEPIYLVFRSLVEHAIETLIEIKERLVTAGGVDIGQIGQISENTETLKSILSKIPEESKIILA